MWRVMNEEGLFEGRSQDEQNEMFDQVKKILRKEDFEQ